MGSFALLGITALSVSGWWMIDGERGMWGGIIGGIVGGGFVLLTVLSVLITGGTSPSMTAVLVLGGWLLKLVALLILLFILRDLDFYSRRALFVTVMAALTVVLGSETWAIVSSRTTYVS
ncbi:hypothetical protein QWU43_05610 [Corynebacterium sp. CCM 9204]